MSQSNGEGNVQPPTENLSPRLRGAEEEQPAVTRSETSAESARMDGRTEDSLQGRVATSPEGLLSVGHADVFTTPGEQSQAIGPQGGATAEQNGGAGTSDIATVILQPADRIAAGGLTQKPQIETETEVKARLRSQQAAMGKSAYLQLDARGQPQKLSGQILFDPKTDTSGTNGDEVTPSDSASQVCGKHASSGSKNSSVATSVARTQAEAYKKQRDLARQKLKECQRQVKQLQDQNEQLQDQLEKSQDAQLESDHQLEARNMQLEGELTDAEAEIARLRAALQVAENEASVSKTRCTVSEHELRQTEEKVAKVERLLAVAKQQAPPRELVEKCRAANAASEKLKSENDTLVAKQAATEEELCQLRIQFREIEGAKRSQAIAQEKEVQQLRAQIQEVESKSARAIAQKDQEITDNLNSVRRTNQSVQRREDQIQDLQEENQSLQDRLDETQKMLDVYSEQAADLASRLEPDNPPVSSQIRSQVISTHPATEHQSGLTAPRSSVQSGTYYAPPLNVNAPPFQQTGGAAVTNLNPTIVGATNLKTTLLAGNSSSSAVQTRSTPASAGRLKMDIPPPEKLDVTRGHASRTQFNKWRKKLKMFFELSGHEETLWPKFIPWYLQGYAEEHVMTFLETPAGREADFEAVMRHIETTLLHKPNAAVTMIEMRQLLYDKRKYTLNEFLQKLMEKQTELKKGEALDDKDMEVVKMDFLYKLPQSYQDFITWHDDWEKADVYVFVSWADHYENRQETMEYVANSDTRSTGFSQAEENPVAEGDFEDKRPIGRYPPRPRRRDRRNYPVSKQNRDRNATGADRRPGDSSRPPPNHSYSQRNHNDTRNSSQASGNGRQAERNGNDRERTESIDSKVPYTGRAVTCYSCGIVGHYAKDCTKPRPSSVQPRVDEVVADQSKVSTNQVSRDPMNCFIETMDSSEEPMDIIKLLQPSEFQLPFVMEAADIDAIDKRRRTSDSESDEEVSVLHISVQTSDFEPNDGLLSVLFDADGNSVQIDEVQVEELTQACISVASPFAAAMKGHDEQPLRTATSIQANNQPISSPDYSDSFAG